MTTRKRLPNGSKEHMRRATEAIHHARRLIRDSRLNIKTNPELHQLMLADTEVCLADALRALTDAKYNAFEEDV